MNSPLFEMRRKLCFYEGFSKKIQQLQSNYCVLQRALERTNLIAYDFDKLIASAEEIKRMFIASLNTTKGNLQ